MDLAGISRLALSFDGVRESRHGGLLRWTIGGRLLARQVDSDSIVVRVGFDLRESLLARHPDALYVPPRFERHQKVAVRICHLPDEVMAELLEAAWILQTESLD